MTAATATVYTGNGAYCYANSLHMALLGSGADPQWLPDPGMLECLTTMPFGKSYVPGRSAFWPSWVALEGTGTGIDFAVETVGWRCERSGGGEWEEALARLRGALQYGPVLLGPLDFGYLTYTRVSRSMAGADHYVTAFTLEGRAAGADECLRVHDPAGTPHALLPVADLADAWRAERIGYKRAPFTMRACFQPTFRTDLEGMVARTLPVARGHLRESGQARGPRTFGGSHALRRLAADLRLPDGPPAGLEHQLLGFSLPTAARRTVDAGRFAEAAGRRAAAAALERQARLWGSALSWASRGTWGSAAEALDDLAVLEDEVAALL